MSPGGSLKFLQRAWRLAGDVTSAPGVDRAGGDLALRKAAHKTVSDAEQLIDGQRFNVMVARMMELVNATRKAIDRRRGAWARPTRRCARPSRRSRSCCPWSRRTPPRRCGSGWATRPPWPGRAGPPSTRRCWSQDSVTAVVQVQGKVRARLEVSPDISEAELEVVALAEPAVRAALDGRAVRTVIVRAPKLVNVVV